MNCDDVRELAGAYVLGALDPEDARAVEAHLSECDLHPDLASLRRTAALLLLSVEERDPPAALQGRIMDAVSGAPISVRAPTTVRNRERHSVRRYGLRTLGILSAALAAFALGTFVGRSLPAGDGPGLVVHVIEASPVAGTELRYITTEGVAVLDIAGLAPPPSGRVYQLWTLRGEDAPRSAGVFSVAADGTAHLVVPYSVAEGDTVAITLEPTGGSEAPTSTPLVKIEI